MSDGGGGGHKRRGHEEEHEEHENHERWLVSYADMMTLLMVLFIVMFAISQVDQKKFMALKTGLSAGFGAPVAMLTGADGLLDVGGAVAPDVPNLAGVAGNKNADPKQAAATKAADEAALQKVVDLVNATSKAQVKTEVDSLKKAEAQLAKALAAAGLAKNASFRFDERGLIVTIATDSVLFDSGGATLLPGGRRILDTVSPTLLKLPNRLSIDGHTNSIPIATAQFPSNWELSTARATGVLRYLESSHGIPYSRMSATGFADTRPLFPASNPKALALNRRVEIVILARIDDSAGRAVAALGNKAPIDATSSTSSVSGTSATPSASASPTALPKPAHNLLGPDPKPTASASRRITKTTRTRATVTTAPRSG
jgi:chemotaxis protein MotB